MNSRHGTLEKVILSALWELEEKNHEAVDVSSIRNIINNEEQNWAYTTIKTVLDRLVDKGLLRRAKQGKKYCYISLYSRRELGENAINKIVQQYYNGDYDALVKAVQELSPKASVLV